jgi:hypothetical protein
VLSLHAGQRRRRDLDYVGAALGVEQIGAAEPVRERLAVIAITDHAIDRSRRRVGDNSRNLPTTAAQLNLFAHIASSLPAISRASRF